MAPGEDVERGRASSAAERQKSIVSMTEFEGMDEYTALQKYILFYRDPRSAGHAQEEPPRRRSGGSPAAARPLAVLTSLLRSLTTSSILSFAPVSPLTRPKAVASAMATTKSPRRRPTS